MKKCLTCSLCFTAILLIASICRAESTRTYIDMDFDWLFSPGDFPAGAMPAFDDSGWRKLNLPHDWSIEGPFASSLGSATGYAPAGSPGTANTLNSTRPAKAMPYPSNSTAYIATPKFGSTASSSDAGLMVIPVSSLN